MNDKAGDYVDWDAVFLRNYSADLLQPRGWFQTAAELTACMAVLEPHVLAWWQSLREWKRKNAPIFREHGFHLTYMMLAAYALENLAKGHLVPRLSSEDRRLVQSGKLPKLLKDHKLIELLNQAQFALDEIETKFAARLESAAVWSGRYPLPARYLDMQTQKIGGGRTVPVGWKGSADVYRAKSLIKRLREHVGARASYRDRSDD